MKRIQMKSIGLFGIIVLFGAGLHSCAESEQDNIEQQDNIRYGIECRTVRNEGISEKTLLTKLYVFSSEGNGDYMLTDSLPQIINGSTSLKLKYTDLNKKSYRFLFISTPAKMPEIVVKRTDNSSFVFGTKWNEVVIEMAKDSMSIDNYYGITDLVGKEILKLGTIKGDLKRMVGQMVFCFYKVISEENKKPVLAKNPDISSVLDRIFSIVIKYNGVPRQITFDANNHPVAITGSDVSLSHTIHLAQTLNGQKVNLPQVGVPIETADSIPGGAILKGLCLLPSNQNIQVSMTFNYYDTTPICGNLVTSHTHEAKCYAVRSLSLELPGLRDALGLNVISDHFTISNAFLPCDRIIDILHTSSIKINTAWKTN